MYVEEYDEEKTRVLYLLLTLVHN